MRRILLAVFLLNVLLLSSTVQAGFGENFLRLFRPQENSDESSSSSSEEVGVKTKVETSVDVSSIVRSIWTILQDLFKTHVLEIQKKAVNILRHETKLLSFNKNKFNLLKLKLSDLKSKKSDSLNRLKYCIPLFRSLEEFYSSKKAEEEEANLLAYYSFAHQIILEILTLLEDNSSNKEVFSTENETKEWEIILSAKFELNMKAGDLQTIYEKLELLKSKRASIKGNIVKAAKTTVVSTVTGLTQNYTRLTYNIWATLHNLITFIVESLQNKTSLLDVEKNLISFYTNHIQAFSNKLDKLATDNNSDRDAIKYLFPLLTRLQNFLQAYVRGKQLSSNALMTEFYTEAYTVIAEMLSIFKASCSEKSIFSLKSFSEELKFLLNSKYLFNIQDKDLNKVYNKVDNLRLKLSQISKTKGSSSLIQTQDTSDVSVAVQIWTLTKELIKTSLTNLEKTDFTRSDNVRNYLLFCRSHYQRLASKLDKLETEDLKSTMGYFIPIFRQFQNILKDRELEKNSEQFGTHAFRTVSEILSIFESKCSNKSVFSVTDFEEELRIISRAEFSVRITKNDLKEILSGLKTLKQKMSEFSKSGVVMVSKNKLKTKVSMKYFLTSLKIWTLTQEIIYSLVFSINMKTTTSTESEKNFISFYGKDYPFFALKLNELGTDKETCGNAITYLIPILKQIALLYYSSLTIYRSKTERQDSTEVQFYSYAYHNVAEILSILRSGSSNQSIFSVKSAQKERKLISTGIIIKINENDLNEIWKKLKLLRENQSSYTTSKHKKVKLSNENQSTRTTSPSHSHGSVSGSEGLTDSSEALISTSSTQSLSSFSKNIYLLTERLFVSLVNSIQTKKSISCEYDAKLLQFYSEHSQFFASKLKEVLTLKNSSQSVLKWTLPLLKRMTTYYYTASRETTTTTTTTTATTSVTNGSAVTSFYSYAYAKLTTILTVLQEKCSDKTIFSTETFSEESKLLSSSAFTLTLQTEDLQQIQETLSTVRGRQSGIFADTNIRIPGVEMKGLISGSEGPPLANGTMSALLNHESGLSNTTSSMHAGTRFEIASRSWRTTNGTSAFVDKMIGNLQILQKYYRDELGLLDDYDGEKIGSSIATVKINGTTLFSFFKRIVSYHEQYDVMTNSRSDSVVQLLNFLRFDRKVQGVLFEIIEEFLEWKTHVADFFVAHKVSEMCLIECELRT